MSIDILIIVAGMAGIACARRLVDRGLTPVLLDKGRGIGGRMATRRVTLDDAELRFDYGAQYVTAREAGFAETLTSVPEAAAVWNDGAEYPHLVGLPGMSGLPRALAQGLDVRQGVEVTALRRRDAGWTVEAGDRRPAAGRAGRRGPSLAPCNGDRAAWPPVSAQRRRRPAPGWRLVPWRADRSRLVQRHRHRR